MPKHHYLPQKYMAPWCIEGHLWWYSQQYPLGRRVSPRSICRVEGLHALRFGLRGGPEDIEQLLARLEGKANAAINELLQIGVSALSAEAKRDLARFVLHLRMRHRAALDAMDSASRELAHDPNFGSLDPSVLDIIRHDVVRESPLRPFANSTDVETLIGWDWVLHTRHDLPTGDVPVVSYTFGKHEVAFSIALAPDALLQMSSPRLTEWACVVVPLKHTLYMGLQSECLLFRAPIGSDQRSHDWILWDKLFEQMGATGVPRTVPLLNGEGM